jgi:hypothetical protein
MCVIVKIQLKYIMSLTEQQFEKFKTYVCDDKFFELHKQLLMAAIPDITPNNDRDKIMKVSFDWYTKINKYIDYDYLINGTPRNELLDNEYNKYVLTVFEPHQLILGYNYSGRVVDEHIRKRIRKYYANPLIIYLREKKLNIKF